MKHIYSTLMTAVDRQMSAADEIAEVVHLSLASWCLFIWLSMSPTTAEVIISYWRYIIIPVTWHKWTHPALTPARQAGTRFTYPGGTEGWNDLGDWLHTLMVYPPTDGHPSNSARPVVSTIQYKNL